MSIPGEVVAFPFVSLTAIMLSSEQICCYHMRRTLPLSAYISCAISHFIFTIYSPISAFRYSQAMEHNQGTYGIECDWWSLVCSFASFFLFSYPQRTAQNMQQPASIYTRALSVILISALTLNIILLTTSWAKVILASTRFALGSPTRMDTLGSPPPLPPTETGVRGGNGGGSPGGKKIRRAGIRSG